MRRTKRAYVPVLVFMAVVGLVLALCLPVGALAKSTAAADTPTEESMGSSTGSSSGDSQSGSSETSGGVAAEEAASTGDASSTGSTGSDAEGASSDSDGMSSAAGAATLRAILAAADGTGTASSDDTVQIQYDKNTGIHYLNDDTTALGRIILYCMNNEAEWPHSIPSAENVPNYTLGYLTPDMFGSGSQAQAAYEECLEKLLAILYAGYPYNGLGLYEIGQTHNITEAEFNEKLDAPSVIRADFPDSVGDTTFTYGDYTNNNTENLTKLHQFMREVGELYPTTKNPNPKSASGLTYQQIIGTDFYQAAYDMSIGQPGSTPLQWWDATHGSDYYVDDSGAYWGTQYAIWVVLNTYGIPENNLTLESAQVKNYPLAARLVQYADASAVLRDEPQDDNVSITGDAQFSYDPSSNTWRTGALSISEGTNYNGSYTLTLPDGLTVVDADGAEVSATDVRAGRAFYLQSSTKPTQTVTVFASANLTWLKETRQYSPVKNADGSEIMIPTATDKDGKTVYKSYQHMIGAVIKQKTVKASLEVAPANEGSLKVTKTVTGEQPSTTSFNFTVTLTGVGSSISGKYGDLEFYRGVAKVSLQDGQFATAEHLPAGVDYAVTEDESGDYSSTSQGASGSITKDATATAAFTNTRLYKLTLSKTVTGQAADASQRFTLKVTLKDANGTPLSGTYSYTGGTVSGSGATAPAAGSITLGADGTGTVALAAGQQVTIAGIPSGTTYTVEETASTAADALLYDATYNGSPTAATGTLSADATVAVVNAVQEGALSVTKHVVGEVNSTREFTFTVTLGGSGAHLSGTYGEMTFTDGKATFTLKDGETKTASALPAGATYTVTEQSDSDYATSSENTDGTIAKGETAQATFTNTRGAVTLPLSGQAGFGVTYAIGLGALAAAAVWMHIRRHAAEKGGDGRD